MKRRAGFTLIELTVVLSVVVVLSGLLIVRVSAWTPRQSLNASARAFGSTLRVWRERARFEETSYRVAWKDRSWSVSAMDGEPIAKGHLGASQAFEDAGELVFDRRGVAPPLAIGLRHSGGAWLRVRIDPVQSDVRYEETR